MSDERINEVMAALQRRIREAHQQGRGEDVAPLVKIMIEHGMETWQ